MHKFRVWKFYDGNVKDGFYLTNEEDVILWNHGYLWRQDDCSDFKDEAIVELFIIYKDNQDIYENDIIEEWNNNKLIRTFTISDIRMTMIELNKSKENSIWKVIGNVHENGENEIC